MKNKIGYIVWVLLMCFSFLGNVYASEVEISASANKTTVTKGEEISISVKVKSDKSLYACSIDISDNDKITYKDGSANGSNGFGVTVGTKNDTVRRLLVEGDISGEDVTDGINIVQFKYIVNESGKITISPYQCSIINGNDSEEVKDIEKIEIDVTALEDEPTPTSKELTNISVRGGKMSPAFSKDIHSYTVQLDSSKFGLSLSAADSDYLDSVVVKDVSGKVYDDLDNIEWNDPTSQSLMKLDIYIDDEVKYQLIVNYTVQGLDNSLESLTIDGKNISLESGKYEYKIAVPKGTTSFNLDAKLKDSDSFQITSVELPGSFDVTGTTTYVALVIEPKASTIGATSVTYDLEIVREGGTTSNNDNTGGGIGSGSGNNVDENPTTGDISMFIMAVILISSFVGSIVLYQKNLESYR